MPPHQKKKKRKQKKRCFQNDGTVVLIKGLSGSRAIGDMVYAGVIRYKSSDM